MVGERWKIGHILKKNKENIQRKTCNESENWIYIEEKEGKMSKMQLKRQ